MVAARSLNVLFVCTANQCRSPMAEVIARDVGQRRGLRVVASSAGTSATDRHPATDEAVRAVRRLGLDLSEHESRQVTPSMVGDADLIVAMERDHVIQLVNEYGADLQSTFTVPELARLVSAAAPLPVSDERSLSEIAGTHSTDDVLRAEEISDPTGRSSRHHRRTAAELAAAIETITGWMSGV